MKYRIHKYDRVISSHFNYSSFIASFTDCWWLTTLQLHPELHISQGVEVKTRLNFLLGLSQEREIFYFLVLLLKIALTWLHPGCTVTKHWESQGGDDISVWRKNHHLHFFSTSSSSQDRLVLKTWPIKCRIID